LPEDPEELRSFTARLLAEVKAQAILIEKLRHQLAGHPMHLHGHVFQIVGLNGRAVSGPRRDTVYVPPMSVIDVALDAGEAARWMLHCHHMPHLATGMMTEFAVSA